MGLPYWLVATSYSQSPGSRRVFLEFVRRIEQVTCTLSCINATHFHKKQPSTSLRAILENCDHVLKGGEREGDHNLGPKALESLQLLDQVRALLAYEFIRVLT